MYTHLIIFILALIGIGVCLYLNYERKRKRPPVCVIGNSCATVWESPYSKIFGVSNEILGIIFYATLAVVEWSIISGNISEQIIIGEIMILVGGIAMSTYYLFVQWRVIRAWCFWCTLSAIIVFLMIIVRLVI
ncbi:MAG: vitamin K epoxide reductase family protein [bacterium]|nr:vitamin K epoxide reductase family protein [bacterium]